MAAALPFAAAALGGLDLLQRERQFALADRQRQAAARSNIARIEADRATEDRRRAQALAAASGAARARLGASGGGSTGGSGEALLAGLLDESEADALDALARRQRQIRDIRTRAAYGSRIDLLERTGRIGRIGADLFGG